MGEVTAPACGPEAGAAAGAAAGAGALTTGAAAAMAAITPARATRMRAPFCSTSISVNPVSAKRSERARIASASMPGLLPDRRDFKSSLALMSLVSFFLCGGAGQNGGHRVDCQQVGIHAQTGNDSGGGLGDIGEVAKLL